MKKAKTTTKKRSSSKEEKGGPARRGASPEIDARIKQMSDWRGRALARVRLLIKQADAEVVEEVKWRKPSNAMTGVPVWSHHGIICTGETYKDKVKFTFAKGASLPPALFNAGLEGGARRVIDLFEGDKIDEKSFKALIRAAVALNTSLQATARPVRSSASFRSPIHKEILAYNAAQSAGDRRICDALAKAIDGRLPNAESKIWHGHPVWFLDGNPIVGYSKLRDCVRLLFWSGQSFDEPGLAPEGSFKAGQVRFTSADQIHAKDLKRWLEKSSAIQWDYKNIVKRKGRLERLK